MKDLDATKSYTSFDHDFFADLLNFDGPLISLFRDKDGCFYLYCWCEVDALHNRWMIVQLDLDSLHRHITGLTNLREIVENPSNQKLYFADMDTHGDYNHIYIMDPTRLPSSYLPGEDSFFTSEDFDCLNAEDKVKVSSLFDSRSFLSVCGNWFPQAASISLPPWSQFYNVCDLLSQSSESLSERFELSLTSVWMDIWDKTYPLNTSMPIPWYSFPLVEGDQFDYALAA